MIHSITLTGKTARSFYLEATPIANLQSVIRGMTSGRSLLIFTKFRADLFYNAESAQNSEILKALGHVFGCRTTGN